MISTQTKAFALLIPVFETQTGLLVLPGIFKWILEAE